MKIKVLIIALLVFTFLFICLLLHLNADIRSNISYDVEACSGGRLHADERERAKVFYDDGVTRIDITAGDNDFLPKVHGVIKKKNKLVIYIKEIQNEDRHCNIVRLKGKYKNIEVRNIYGKKYDVQKSK